MVTCHTQSSSAWNLCQAQSLSLGKHMVRIQRCLRIVHGKHKTRIRRKCMSQTESRWLEQVTRLGGASMVGWRLCGDGRLQLLRSRTSLAPPHLAYHSVQLRLWSVSDLASCGTFPGPANLRRLLSLTPGRWRPPRDRFGWLRPITFTHCSPLAVAGMNSTSSKPTYLAPQRIRR